MNDPIFSNAWGTATDPSYTRYDPYIRWNNTTTTSNVYSGPWQVIYESPTPRKSGDIWKPPNDEGKELFTDEELSELLDN